MKKFYYKKAIEEIEEKIEYVPTYREAVLIRDIIEIINNNIEEQEESKKIEKIDLDSYLGSSNYIKILATENKINEIIEELDKKKII